MSFLPESWSEVLLPQAPVLESVVRASAIYLFVFLIFRVVLRREAGGLGISDLMVILLVAAAAHGSLSPREAGVADGAILIATIVLWDWLLSLLAFHWGGIRRLVRARPVLIVRGGMILSDAARRQLLTRGEIMEQLRLHGVPSLAHVQEAYLEPDGELSVIRTPEGDGAGGAGESRKLPPSPDLHR